MTTLTHFPSSLSALVTPGLILHLGSIFVLESQLAGAGVLALFDSEQSKSHKRRVELIAQWYRGSDGPITSM